MARIGNVPQQDYTEAEGNSWRNPNSIVRNTLRIRDGEMALFTFAQELLEGDMSYFHTVPEEMPSGKLAYPSVYCLKNENEQGILLQEECPPCVSTNREVRIRRKKYHYWIYVYNAYRKEQNPGAGNYPDAVEWPLAQVGRNQWYCESFNKPQLIQFSSTMWSTLDNLVGSMVNEADMVGQVFRYDHIKDPTGRHQYMLTHSTVPVDTISIQDINSIHRAMPNLEHVLSGQINEFDFSQFARTERGLSTADEQAFSRIAGETAGFTA